jgi:hypothetical protein
MKSADPTADLTVAYEEGGAVLVEELAKVILQVSPSWATVAFLSREHHQDGTHGAPRVSLRRYKKRGGRFIVDKHFTLTTKAQALACANALQAWFADGGPGDTAGSGDRSDVDEDAEA